MAPHRLGCVSFLNTKPLIDGLEGDPRFILRLEVPAKLPALLLEGKVDLALCPVFDLFTAGGALEAVPCGGIASDGETLTVKLFSRVPLAQVKTVAADPDSHTSVNLLRVLWRQRHGRLPELLPIDAPADATLLIGDKVISRAPDAAAFPWTLDLGAAWKEATGLPFVFAVWMKRRGEPLGELPALLADRRERNAAHLGAIADRHGGACGWPESAKPLARRYLSEILGYAIGPREEAAMALFGRELAAAGLAQSPGDGARA